MEHDPRFYRNTQQKHKMTTDVQYNLLKTHMTILSKKEKNKNNSGKEITKYKKDYAFWTELTEKLNNYGPPFRTIQQWKKVWCDFRRAQRKRGYNYKPKVPQYIKQEPNNDNTKQAEEEETREEISAEDTSSKLQVHIKTEKTDCEQNSQSMCTTYSNEYDNDYSYPDDEEDSLQDSHLDDMETFIPPDESSCGSYSYASHRFNKTVPGGYVDHQPESKKLFASPPPLQPSRFAMPDQTLYTLQNQMEHQTKLLEHLTKMSSAMAGLMESQVLAIEKQTEAIKRQAFATERHTSVMNNFIDMIHEKMFKENSSKRTTSTNNSLNEIF